MSKLKEMRIKRKLTQKQLAEASNINLRTLQCYEQKFKDINGAKLKTLIKLCKVLDCNLIDIIEEGDAEFIELIKNVSLR